MKKILVLLLAAAMLTGCGKTSEPKEKETTKKEETQEDNNKQENDAAGSDQETGEQPEETPPVTEPVGQKVTINVYSIDDGSGEMVAQAVECDQLDAAIVWAKLQEKGVIPSEATMISLQEDSQGLTLDTAVSFGGYIRGLGTNGEDEVLKCITYTYLEAYAGSKIQITEAGQTLITGHRELEGYKGKEDYK